VHELKSGLPKESYHLLSDVDSFAENCSQTNSWEHIHVAMDVSANAKKLLEQCTTHTFPGLVASPGYYEDKVGKDFHSQR
jgi:hypothetical protein